VLPTGDDRLHRLAVPAVPLDMLARENSLHSQRIRAKLWSARQKCYGVLTFRNLLCLMIICSVCLLKKETSRLFYRNFLLFGLLSTPYMEGGF
jgi:hypothetical protein